MSNKYISSRKGNAIMISIAITGFLFVAAAGASKVITASLRDSSKIVDNSKALYSAESALESALFEASGRNTGFEHPAGTAAGDVGFVGFNNINSSKGSWSTGSQTEKKRLDDTSSAPTEYQRVIFIPPRRTETELADRFDLANWRKVKMGETIPLNLWVDTSSYRLPLPMGNENGVTTTNVSTPLPTIAEDIVGPNGIRAGETESIFGEFGTDSNDDLEDMFIDVLIPVSDVAARNDKNPILLSWKLEGLVKKDTFTTRVVSLNALAKCNIKDSSTPTGVICRNNYSDSMTNENIFSLKNPDAKTIANDKLGMLLRIQNPMGILNESESGGGYQLGIKDFLRRNFPAEMSYLLSAPIYFPRLVLQMGPRFMAQPIGGSMGNEIEIAEAYVRVGFKINGSTTMDNVISDFPLPDDKISINASGTAGSIKHQISAEIEPQEVAPMFDYAVFQQ